jgi:hypothetical protein
MKKIDIMILIRAIDPQAVRSEKVLTGPAREHIALYYSNQILIYIANLFSLDWQTSSKNLLQTFDHRFLFT